MSFTFFNEMGVEPLAYVGQAADLEVYIPDVIHKLYSGDKLNLLTKYNCGRYIDTPEENRYPYTKKLNRIVQTKEGNCK